MEHLEAELQNPTRPTEVITLKIPVDTIVAIKKVAVSRHMPYEALIKYYIGQGLREDLAQLLYDRIFETIPEVLARHIASDDEVRAIIEEIQAEALG
jgi:hypothetical protein